MSKQWSHNKGIWFVSFIQKKINNLKGTGIEMHIIDVYNMLQTVYIPPKLICWSSNSQCDGVWRQCFWEVHEITGELKLALFTLAQRRDCEKIQQNGRLLQVKNRELNEIYFAITLISVPQPLELWEINFLLFKPFSLWDL